jgi:hypothetical protein
MMAKGAVFTGVIAVANFAGFVVSVWDGIRAVQGGNNKEATGYFIVAFGAAILTAQAVIGFGTTATAASVAPAVTGVGIPWALVVALIGTLLIGIGSVVAWIYHKSDFQVLLENCFWGNGERYRLWDKEKERLAIEDRLSKSQKIGIDHEMSFNYQVELQEFMNLLYMPKLDLDVDSSWSAHTYTYTFTLPNFQVGLSDIEFALYPPSVFEFVSSQPDQEAIRELRQAMERALQKQENIVYKDGSAIISLSITLKTKICLIWAYTPQPGTTVPARFLIDGGVKEPVVGMVNGRLI